MIDQIATGFGDALQAHNILVIVVGVSVGIIGGATPGLSGSTTVALLLPFTFGLPADTSLILLAAVFVGAEYGGSIPAIFVNMPATPSAVVTTLDGYALSKLGYPIKALCASLIPGVVGGILATIALITLSGPLTSFALAFGPAEYFALGVLGLTLIVRLGGTYWPKTLIATCIGLFLAVIGGDAITGAPRFVFGIPELLVGIPLVPALIGLLALSEAFMMIEEARHGTGRIAGKVQYTYPTWKEWKSMAVPTARGSVIGIGVGVIPGAGGAISSIVAYNEEKRWSKHPEKFGTGVIEGIAAPESANNAVVGGALLPMLTLGIPGSPTAAIMLGALTIHGLQPGPSLFSESGNVVYSLFASQFLANLAMLLLGLVGMTWWARIVSVPKAVLAPCIIVTSFVGAYAASSSMSHVTVAVVLGIVGYWLRKLEFPIGPVVLAFVLGSFVESNFRRMLLISGNDLGSLLYQPIFMVLSSAVLATLLLPLLVRFRPVNRLRSKTEAGNKRTGGTDDNR